MVMVVGVLVAAIIVCVGVPRIVLLAVFTRVALHVFGRVGRHVAMTGKIGSGSALGFGEVESCDVQLLGQTCVCMFPSLRGQSIT